MPNRHRSRELAVQYIYQWSLNQVPLDEISSAAKFFWSSHSVASEDNKDYFLRVVSVTLQNLPEIDSKIEELSENWRLDRIDKVDLAVLRVAFFEIFYELAAERADFPVVIDEAVEIAKKFGSKDSPSFVNGILDKAAKKVGAQS